MNILSHRLLYGTVVILLAGSAGFAGVQRHDTHAMTPKTDAMDADSGLEPDEAVD